MTNEASSGAKAKTCPDQARAIRVLYLDTAPTVGGSVISLYELLRGLDRTRHEPVVVSYASHEYVNKFRSLGADVLVWDAFSRAPDHRPAWVGHTGGAWPVRGLRRMGRGSDLYHALGFAMLLMRRVWPRAKALRRIIAERKIDLVHTNIRVGHDREGILAARMSRVPCVCHIRDFEKLGSIDRKLAGMATQCIYISRAVQTSHLESGVPRAKGQVVYNGLDISAFADELAGSGGRRSLGLADNDMAIGVVGRIESWKGQEFFLKAMALVKDVVPRARGIVIGASVPYEPHYRDELLALRDELGLSERVLFSDFRSDIPAIMAALDIVVLTSISPEPFGRVLIEAMAAGKPVVATDAGATPEIIEDGAQGFLVPPKDEQALARAIARVAMDPSLALAMGQRGRVTVQERFNVQQYVDGVQAVYQLSLADHRGRLLRGPACSVMDEENHG